MSARKRQIKSTIRISYEDRTLDGILVRISGGRSDSGRTVFDSWDDLKEFIEGKRRAGVTVRISKQIRDQLGYSEGRLPPITNQ